MNSPNVEMTKKQLEAYTLLTDNVTGELLYWGGARWWKSYLWCMWIVLQCLEKPWSAWLIGRQTLLSLKQSTLLDLWKVIDNLGIPRDTIHYRQDEQMIHFKNKGSRIFLKGLPFEPSDPEYNWLGSLTLTGYFIDEAQEIRPKAVEVLRWRCSLLEWTDEKWETSWRTIPKALYTCNPDKGWVNHDFYKPYKDWELTKDKAFIPALVADNSFMSIEARQSYIRNLRKSGKITVQRLLYGNFDYDETLGKIFEYDALKAMFTNPDVTWKKYITCDISRGWGDRTVIMLWEGYTVRYIYTWNDQKIDFAQDKIKELCQTYKIPMNRVVIDENWVGWGAVDTLKCRGFIGNRKAISPMARKFKPELTRNYHDLRVQCLTMMAKLVNDRRISITDTSIEKDIIDELELVCHTNIDKDEAIRLTTKDIMKSKLPDNRSPDLSDGFYMRSFFDLFLTDEELDEIDRVYNPHIDEDIYWHTMSAKQGIDEWLAKQARAKNVYQAGLANII